MHNHNHKGRASTLSKALLAAGVLGIIGYGNAANAASKFFYNQKIVVKTDPGPSPISPEETFVFDLETDDFLTTITRPGHTNPGTVTPTDPTLPQLELIPIRFSHRRNIPSRVTRLKKFLTAKCMKVELTLATLNTERVLLIAERTPRM